jgi:hypothetical protein
MADPAPTPVFDAYWRFAAERQETYFRRLAGGPGPWTADPVIAAHRFTNAYRVADRVSQRLVRDVQYGEGRPRDPDEVFFRTVLFKTFNREATWDALERALGPLEWRTFDCGRVAALLDGMLDRGERVYSAAYIMPSPPLGQGRRKHANHLALVGLMMRDGLPAMVRRSASLAEAYQLLRRYPGMGRFLAFQYAVDLGYGDVHSHDEAGFVVAGPGALDGISKCFSGLGGRTPEELIHWVAERQERELAERGLEFRTLFGRRLQPVDCQNLFCEVSKYSRVTHPQFAGVAGRTRIKQAYRPDPRPMTRPFFPPRWGLRTVEGDSDREEAGQERMGTAASRPAAAPARPSASPGG